jgi:hypothetical protein
VGQAARGCLRRLGEVVDRPVGAAQGGGLREVVGQPLGPPFRRRGRGLQEVGHPQVLAGPAGGRHEVEHRLPGEGVRKTGTPGRRAQEAEGDRGVEGGEGGVGAPGGGVEDRGQIGLLAHHGGELEGLSLGVGTAARRGPATMSRTDSGAADPSRGPPPGGRLAHQLPQQEGVAAGPVPHQGGGDAGPVGGQPGLVREVLGDVLGVQPGEVQPPHAVEPVEVRDGAGQLRRALGRRRPVCGETSRVHSAVRCTR